MNRPSWDEYFALTLKGIASRGTCPRRQTSSIITDKDHNILATGYNGPPRGINHCTDFPCEGVNDEKGDSSRCLAVHSEQNALLQAGDRLRFAEFIYCSNMPCFTCAKLICQTSIKRVFYVEDYADDRATKLFLQADIQMIKIKENK